MRRSYKRVYTNFVDSEKDCNTSDWTEMYALDLSSVDAFVDEICVIAKNEHLLRITCDDQDIINLSINDLFDKYKSNIMKDISVEKSSGKYYISIRLGDYYLNTVKVYQKRRSGENKKTTLEGFIVSYREIIKLEA